MKSSSTYKSWAERRRLVQTTHYRLSSWAQPSHAQQAAQPYLDGIFEASEHIKKEITRNGESNSPSNSHRVRLTIAPAWLVRQVIRSQT